MTVVKDPVPSSPADAPDPAALLRSPNYIALLVFGAIIGVPVAAVAYFFLKPVAEAQHYVFATLPSELGFDAQPAWWPLPWLALSGLLVALTIRYLPGTAGHKPAEGFKTGGPVPPIDLPGIVLASFATLSLGVVLGPEAPLIAIGSGLGVLAVHLVKRDAPAMASAVIGAAGSFAAISTLLGSPIAGRVPADGGRRSRRARCSESCSCPGCSPPAIGSLIFVGLDNWTGFGTFSLAVPNIPHFGAPDRRRVPLGDRDRRSPPPSSAPAIRRLALLLQPIVERRMVLLTPVVGLAIGGLAHPSSSRRPSTAPRPGALLGPGRSCRALIENAAGWTVGALRAARRLQGPRLRVCR